MKDDLISRQAAIDAIRASTLKYTGFMEMEMYTDDDAVEAIEGLPSAELERKTGRWELLPLSTITPVYKCSACGRHAVWITTGCLVNRHYESYLSDFCPSCGADMREKHERFN